MRYLDTQKIVRKNIYRLNKERQYEYLHFRTHWLINAIANFNVIDRRSKILLPTLIKNVQNIKVSLKSLNSLEEIITLLNELSNKNYRFRLDGTLKNFIKTTLEVHNIVKEYLYKYKKTYLKIVKPQKFKEEIYLNKNLQEVVSFSKEITKIKGLKEVFIHGSLSTLDYTKFSDFDTFIIIDQEAEKDINLFLEVIVKLLNTSRLFYKYDPYQHHRYFVCLETDLNIYNQSSLPPEVLQYGTAINNTNILKFKVYDSKLSHLLFLTNVLNYFAIHYKWKFKGISNLWNLKYFLATVFFIPVLFLEVKNIYVYKRDSFQITRNILPQNLQAYLDNCTILRNIWDYKLTIKEEAFRKIFLDFLIHPILYEYLMSRHSQKINKENFQNIFWGSISYVNFFFKEIEDIYIKEFNIDVTEY